MKIIKRLQPFGVLVGAPHEGDDLRRLNADELETYVLEEKLVVLRGFAPMEESDLADFAKQFGPLLSWEFGEVLNLKVSANPQNHLFRNGRVEMHWDGAYLTEVPRFSLFQCIHSEQTGSGGETIFTDTEALIEKLDDHDFQAWQSMEIAYRTEKAAHYSGSVMVPLMGIHPETGAHVLRYIEPYNEDNLDINPVQVEVAEVPAEEQQRLLMAINRAIYQPDVMYQHQWKTGDYLIYDNQALLHGRNRLHGNATRHLQRVHILSGQAQDENRRPVFIGAREQDVHV